VNLLASYTPPSLGASTPATSYSYDLDRRLSNVARPDGVSVSYSYDYTGRLQSLTMPLGTVYYGYDSNTGYLGYVTRPDGEGLYNSYDGFLKTRTS
jgi:YD repeat-containing protein